MIVTPDALPHELSRVTHAEELSNWGYGSQIVYVLLEAPEPEPAPEPPDEVVEQALAPTPTTSTAIERAAARRRVLRGRAELGIERWSTAHP